MKAIIIAGGNGQRLKKYCFQNTKVPKPLLKIGGTPLLELIIKQLVFYGFNDILLSTRFKSEVIEKYFSESKNIPKEAKITFLREEKPLGTIGPISLIQNLNETLLVMHGDILTDLDFSKLLEFHKNKKSDVTLAVMKTKLPPLGIIKTEANIIKSYNEKAQKVHLDSMSILLCEPKILKYLKKNSPMNIDKFINLVIKKEKALAYISDEKIIDIGTDEEYEKANESFLKNRKKFIKSN